MKLVGGYWRSFFIWQKIAKPTEVAQVMGACLMMRPLERFDERFFLYCEDTDLCKRLRRHGTIVYDGCPPDFVHELGSSSSGENRWLGVARYNRGKELYFSIHHGAAASAVCWLFDRLGAFARLVLYVILDMFTLGKRHASVKLWWKVLTAPRLGPDRR
jgi:GT2 family glycosyltransferase